MKSKEIRKKWLDFFKSKNHLIIPSKSLVPENDNSLLWINSGVATLKDYFSGKKIPPSKRLANSQKALRTNDIENVGKTSRHHTFFEMLGNFSIGDYFKKEAIAFAFEFIFDVLKMDKKKIYFTYFNEDIETKKILESLNVEKSHIITGNRNTNFWDIGNGPCGPNMEIFYDRGKKYAEGGIELLENDIDNDRYIEIWNIVFSQFNNDGNGNYEALSQKNIDTGAGLERLASILQNTHTNFETDLFMPIIKEIEKISIYKYDVENYFKNNLEQNNINLNLKIISDHIRSAVNAINDGAEPSNNGRGYIIRRLIRRAYRSGLDLGIKQKTFLHKLVKIVKDSLIYDINVEKVAKIIEKEEISFSKTLVQGIELLEKHIKKMLPKNNSIDVKNKKMISKYFKDNNLSFDFKIAFMLFETFGFPVEITKEILEQQYGIDLDLSEFPKYLEIHAKKSQSFQSKGMKDVLNSLNLVKGKVSQFIGYSHLENNANILYLLDNEKEISSTKEEDISYIILDKTPFYATAGGQRHDKGSFFQRNQEIKVLDVFKDKFLNNVHKVKGKIFKNESITAKVNPSIRIGLERNHSGTHLLFNALSEKFGEQIKQLGSDNNEERLTFDFPLERKPSWQELKEIEKKINSYIASDIKREYIETTLEEAKKMGAVMTLEEQEYMDPTSVRIVHFPNITSDLCGGTHVSSTQKLEKFKIISLDSKGSNIYRIRAITGNEIVNSFLENEISKNTDILQNLITKNTRLDTNYKVKYQLDNIDDLDKKNLKLLELIEFVRKDYKKLIKKSDSSVENQEVKENWKKLENLEYYFDSNAKLNSIKNLAAFLREKTPKALVILVSKLENKSFFICVASKTYPSDEVAKIIFQNYEGKGGGNKILSQGNIFKKIDSEIEIIKLLKQNKVL